MDQNLPSPSAKSLHASPLWFMKETSINGSAAAWFLRAGLVAMTGAPSMVPACVHVTLGLMAQYLGMGPPGLSRGGR